MAVSSGWSVLVIGAGEMGTGFSKALDSHAPRPGSRREPLPKERGADHLARAGAVGVASTRLDEELERADVVLTSTAAEELVLDVARDEDDAGAPRPGLVGGRRRRPP